MDVFISWSGEKSKKSAEALREWLPSVIQAVTPYYSPNDIDKGARWLTNVSGRLDKSQFGILLVTRENLNSPWILFEAGALSKNVGASNVCPILLDLKPTDLSGPLVQFQATEFNKEEIRKLIESINGALEDKKINDKTLGAIYEKWWPDLEKNIQEILHAEPPQINSTEIRSDRDILEEILRLTRSKRYSSFEPGSQLLRKLTHQAVTYSQDTRTINIWLDNEYPYPIHLEQISSTADLLDFILQVNRKGISRPEHIKGLLDCIEELTDRYFQSNAQGVFCPCGQNRNVEWPID